MKIDFGDWSLTSREIIVSVVGLIIAVFIGLFLADGIENSDNEEDLRYNQALSIDYDKDKLIQVIQTDAGDAFVSGHFKAVDPVYDSHINGKWLMVYYSLQKEVEQTHVYVDSKGHPHTTTTWTWREISNNTSWAGSIQCNGVTFSPSAFNYSNIDKYTETVYLRNSVFFRSKNRRMLFECIPESFSGAFFTTFQNRRMADVPKIYQDVNCDKLREIYTTHYGKTLLCIFGLILIVPGVIFFVREDNDWLENLFKK